MNLNKSNLNKENNLRVSQSICDRICTDELTEYDNQYIKIWSIINIVEKDSSYTFKELMSAKINQIKNKQIGTRRGVSDTPLFLINIGRNK